MDLLSTYEDGLWDYFEGSIAPAVVHYQQETTSMHAANKSISATEWEELLKTAVLNCQEGVSEVIHCIGMVLIITQTYLNSQVLTFLQSDVTLTTEKGKKRSFAILPSQLHAQLATQYQFRGSPAITGSSLEKAFGERAKAQIQTIFLKPGSHLTYVPSGRVARSAASTDTVFRRAVFVWQSAISQEVRQILQKGMPHTR